MCSTLRHRFSANSSGGYKAVPLLGGSGVVISRVISPLIWVTISIVTLLTTLLITTHQPPRVPTSLRCNPLRACDPVPRLSGS